MVAMGADREEALLRALQSKSWTTFRDTAFAAWQAKHARLQPSASVVDGFGGQGYFDASKLRSLEREELIRQTLYWIIGVQFDPTPSEVGQIVEKLVRIEQAQLPDMFRHLSNDEWETAGSDFLAFLQLIKKRSEVFMALVFNNANVEHGKSYTFTFNQKVSDVTVGIQGYSVRYPSSDNHVRKINVNAEIASISGQQVTVTATCVMHDDSNNYAYGSVDITCIAVV